MADQEKSTAGEVKKTETFKQLPAKYQSSLGKAL
jgi:hypothetical protein